MLVDIIGHGLTVYCFLESEIWIKSGCVDHNLRDLDFKHDAGIWRDSSGFMKPKVGDAKAYWW
jgi:hypothetical protein